MWIRKNLWVTLGMFSMISGAWLASAGALGATSQAFKLTTPRGAIVQGLVNLPGGAQTGTAQFPVLVLAPGQGYHMEMPILAQLAESAAGSGIAVFRFNWAYFTADPKNGQPSDDLKKEIEDMKTVIEFALKDPHVDGSKLLLAGKSLGSLVSYPVFEQTPAAKGLVLLTPICTQGWDDQDKPLPQPLPSGAENYPGLTAETRPIVMTLGNHDPNCQIPMLYDFLKGTKGNVATVVVGGDHSLNIGGPADPRSAANIAATVVMTTNWLQQILGAIGQ